MIVLNCFILFSIFVIVANPILIILIFILFNRKEFIKIYKRRPTIKDIWDYMVKDCILEVFWWFPPFSFVVFLIFVLYLIIYPIVLVINYISNFIINIKI